MARVEKVLLIGIDGLMLQRAIASGKAPTLQKLKADSYFVETEVAMPTISGPSWATLLTGKTQDVHQIIDNELHGHNLKDAPDLMSQARSRNPKIETYVAAGWPPLVYPNGVGPIISDPHSKRFHMDGETLGYLTVDKAVFEDAFHTISEHGPHINFVYFCEADESGHLYGTIEGPYFEAIARIDSYVDKLYECIKQRNINFGENWLIIIVTDHGHRDEGGHGGDSPQECASFVIAHGVGTKHPQWPSSMNPEDLVHHMLSTL